MLPFLFCCGDGTFVRWTVDGVHLLSPRFLNHWAFGRPPFFPNHGDLQNPVPGCLDPHEKEGKKEKGEELKKRERFFLFPFNLLL
jgi:hypothetical protein